MMRKQLRRVFNGPSNGRWRAPGLLALLCTLAYLPPCVALFFHCYPFGEDAVAFFVPQHTFASEWLHRGIVPLWNPHLFCGAPFAGNIQTGLFYPPNLIYALLAAPAALLLDAWAHTVWLAFGSYLLARELRLSRTSSCLAAILLALGGATSARIYAGQMIWLQAHSYVPWILWALLCYLREGESRYVLLFSVLLSALVLCGHPPTILFSLAMCVAVVTGWLLRNCDSFPSDAVVTSAPAKDLHPPHRGKEGSHAARQRLPHGWPKMACGACGLCVLLTAVAMLPFFELNRWAGHSSLSFTDATVLSGTWKSLVRLLLPDFFGGNSGVQWSSRWGAHEEVAYLGVLPLLLALGAPFFIRRTSRPIKLVWLALPLVLIIAMGANTPLYEFLFDAVPLMRVLRVPARWLDFWIYGVIFLSAFVFESLFVRTDEQKAGYLLLSVRIVAVLLALGILVVALSPAGIWDGAAHVVVHGASGLKLAAVADDFRRVALISMASAFLLQALSSSLIERSQKAPNASARRQMNWALVGFMSLDLLALFWRSAKIVTPKDLTDIAWPADLAKRYRPQDRWDTDVFWQGIDRAALEKIDIYNGYDPLGTKRYFDFASADEKAPTWEAVYQPSRRSALLAVAGVSHTIAGPRDPDTPFPDTRDMKLEATSHGWTLWRHNRAPWPRQYLAQTIFKTVGSAQLLALQELTALQYSVAPPAVIDARTIFEAAQSREPNDVSDTLTRDVTSPNRVQIFASNRAPRLLVVSESMFPGWRSFVNGKVVPTKTANYLFRGVAIDAGHSEVEMIFDPESYRLGLFLSLCGLSLSVALCASARRRNN